MNISELIDQYEQGAGLRGLAPTQMEALKPVGRGFGTCEPRHLIPERVAHYVGGRRKGLYSNAHGSRCAKDGTIRRELGALQAVLNWAHAKGLLKDKPPSIDLPPPSPPREVFLTKAEADSLWHAATQWEHDNTGLFTCLALDTWARAAAIETLPWERCRLQERQIDYRDPTRPETKKRRVPVPMSTRLWERLCWLYSEEKPAYDDAVVGPVTQYAWKRFLECGCPPLITSKRLTRHDLRRTGISLAVARGVDLLKVAQMAGDDYNTILKHYARFAPDYLDGVVT